MLKVALNTSGANVDLVKVNRGVMVHTLGLGLSPLVSYLRYRLNFICAVVKDRITNHIALEIVEGITKQKIRFRKKLWYLEISIRFLFSTIL